MLLFKRETYFRKLFLALGAIYEQNCKRIILKNVGQILISTETVCLRHPTCFQLKGSLILHSINI